MKQKWVKQIIKALAIFMYVLINLMQKILNLI